MKKYTRISMVGLMATALLLLTVLVMVSQVWAQESQDVTIAPANKEARSEFRQDAVTLSQPGVINFLSGPTAGEPLDIALDFIQTNRDALGLTDADLADVTVTSMYQTKANGVTHIYLRQRFNGIEVYGTDLNINVAADGSVINIGSRFASNLAEGIIGHTPTLSAVAATEAAAQHLGLHINQPLVVEQSLGGAAQAVVLSDGGISLNSIPARLMYQPTGDSSRLSWDLIIYQLDAHHWWNLRVDAATGEVLDKFDYVIHEDFLAQANAAHGSLPVSSPSSAPGLLANTYLVYPWPVESPNYASPAPPADARTITNNPAGDAIPDASPFGWHSDNVTNWTDTQGNNVDSHKGAVRHDCGATLDCTPGLDLTVDPTTAVNVAAATVNLFYWNNITHDVWYQYGFDEASGNFQNNNNGQGGIGNDRVNANAQAPGNCNATFGTPIDGSQPTMNMFICNLATPSRDGDLDNGVIVHEYGHGISNRLTGGPLNVSCLNNAEQMGEGWSDWFGLMMTIEAGDTGPDPRGIGTWLLGEGPNGPGVRNQLYSTNFAVNTHTYDDIITASGVHDTGEVWATMIWEMTWELVANGVSQNGLDLDIYNGTGGNNLAMQLIIDGLKLQPCSPGFVDGRDAILMADQANNGGVNQCAIWAAFARRGLGFSADQGSSGSRTDGTEAFDLPPACLTLDVTPLSQSICQGQTATYTVSVGTAFTPPVTMSASGNPAPTTAIYTSNPVNTVPTTTDLTIGNTATAPTGMHVITIEATDGSVSDSATVDLGIYASAPASAAILILPVNGATSVATSPSLTWNTVSAATSYFVEIATDPGFTNIVYTANEPTTTHQVGSSLAPNATHYWRVTAENPCGSSAASSSFSFTTVNIICRQPALAIPDNTTVNDATTIATNGTLLDVNISIDANHTWVGDTTFTLTHNDTGTSVTMIDRPGYTGVGFGCSGDNIDVELDDEGTDGPVENQCSNNPALFGNPTPNNPLSAFDGEDLNGTWTLSVSDSATGDTGLLNEWCIIPVTQPVGYSIELNKTVGIDPNTCAATDSITLPPGGGDVTYCYTVTNTGQNDLTLHTLVDDQLGTILNSFPYTLTAGSSYFITTTTPITSNVVNVATWTASDGSDSVSATDSASVIVQYYVPDILTDASITSSQPTDAVITQTLQITNVGEVTSTMSLASGGSDLIWSIQEDAGKASQMFAAPIVSSLAPSSTSGDAAETISDATTDGLALTAPEVVMPYVPQGNILYDNGPLINSPGTGSGGADESMLQTNLGMGIIGFGHQIVNNNSMADDFVIPAGEQWTIDTITFFAYQTGSSTTSTITGMNVDIYNGDPSAGGVVIASSSTMLSSQWANAYRVTATTSGDTQRPIMATVMDLGGLVLTEGTYWIEWQASGSLASGPWAPAVTVNGQTATGNGLQNLNGTWGAATDVGQQGLPFVISGSSGCASDIPWLTVSPANGTTALFDTTNVNVTFDSAGLATGTYTGALCISSNDPDEPLVTVPVTLSVVVPVYAIDIAPDSTVSGLPGTTVTHTMWVTNNSNVAGPVSLIESGNSWDVTFSDNNFILNQNEVAMVYVWVAIPAGADGGSIDMATVTASIGDASDSATATTTAEAVYGVEVASDTAATGSIGSSVHYHIWITNTGSTADIFNITVTGEDWTTTPEVSSVALDSGESMMVMVMVDIPGDAASGDMDVATVTATSDNDASVSGSVTLTTTAEGSVIYLPFVVKG